jgi:hypothetical protein
MDPKGHCKFQTETILLSDPRPNDNPLGLPVGAVDGEISVNPQRCGFQSKCGYYVITTVIDSASFNKGAWTILPKNWTPPDGGWFGLLINGQGRLGVEGLPDNCSYGVRFDRKSRFPGAPRAIVDVACSLKCDPKTCKCKDDGGTAAITYFQSDPFGEPGNLNLPEVSPLQQLRFDWRVILRNKKDDCTWGSCTTFLKYTQWPNAAGQHIGPGGAPSGTLPMPQCQTR